MKQEDKALAMIDYYYDEDVITSKDAEFMVDLVYNSKNTHYMRDKYQATKDDLVIMKLRLARKIGWNTTALLKYLSREYDTYAALGELRRYGLPEHDKNGLPAMECQQATN